MDAALELPKELPAPLRAWLTHGDRARVTRFLVGVYGSSAVVALWASGNAALGTSLFFGVGTLLVVPSLSSTRRLISGGYGLDDLRAAVGTHVARKREELEYEATAAFALSPRRLMMFSGVMAAAAIAAAASIPVVSGSLRQLMPAFAAMGGVLATASALAAGIRYGQMGKIGWLGSPRLRFWKSKWGERAFALAGIGVKKPAAASALPQHTEVALGRALDALFESLPRATRRELRDVPATVRRLEDDARKLREAVDALDEAVAAAQRAGQPGHADKLLRDRDLATERLANTVTALETIRLGLLRLQIGAAPVTSVTEAIEAATRLGREMEIAAQAEREVSAAIKRRD